MDPVSLIVGALAAGAASGLTETGTTAVKDAYQLLRKLVGRLFAGKPVAEAALKEHATNPDGPDQQADLATQLERAHAGTNQEILDAAKQLLEAADPGGAAAGKYRLDLRGAQVGAVGDHNTNTITFGAPPATPPS